MVFTTLNSRVKAAKKPHSRTTRASLSQIAARGRIACSTSRVGQTESATLRRAIAGDDDIQMPALVRIAKREPKFEWRGKAGESVNPLLAALEPRKARKRSATTSL